MTKQEVIEKGQFEVNERHAEYSEFKIRLYLQFFRQEHEVQFFQLPSLDSEPQITLISDIVNDLLNFDSANEEWLKDEIWRHFNVCIENTSYGMVPDEGFDNEVDANRAYFKIQNRDDAYRAVNLTEIWTDVGFTKSRYFNLWFDCPWEDEHGIKIGVENGKLHSIE